MQNTATTTILFRSLGVALVVAALWTDSHATGAAEYPQGAGAWMPDVGERIAALRERALQASAEARERRNEPGPGGQWWRAVAARPALEVPR